MRVEYFLLPWLCALIFDSTKFRLWLTVRWILLNSWVISVALVTFWQLGLINSPRNTHTWDVWTSASTKGRNMPKKEKEQDLGSVSSGKKSRFPYYKRFFLILLWLFIEIGPALRKVIMKTTFVLHEGVLKFS